MDEILHRDDIDAVLIATGDRWHAPASIRAARAGKDVFCEKPCSMTIAESAELEAAFTTHNRIFQAGTQRRNVDNFRLACSLARDGKLGTLQALHAGIVRLGPASMRPYNQDYLRGRWRGHEGLSASYQLPEWGSHTLDLCQWAADADATAPVEYEPDGTTIHATYANGIRLVMRTAGFRNEGDWIGLGTCPVRFEGEEGWIEAGDSGKLAASREDLFGNPTPEPMFGTDPSKHVDEFIECVKSRQQPACDAKTTRHGHVACHAAAIAWKLGRKLRFDPATETFIGDDEANSMRSQERRKPYDV